MNGAHIHLLLNHIPLVGTLIGAGLLAFGAWRRNGTLSRAGLAIFVAMAIVSLPAYLSGEGAEEIVEEMEGVSEEWLEAHEESALPAALLSGALGALALAALVIERRRDRPRGWAIALGLVGALAVLVSMGYTASLGGSIHHPEVRPGFVQHAED